MKNVWVPVKRDWWSFWWFFSGLLATVGLVFIYPGWYLVFIFAGWLVLGLQPAVKSWSIRCGQFMGRKWWPWVNAALFILLGWWCLAERSEKKLAWELGEVFFNGVAESGKENKNLRKEIAELRKENGRLEKSLAEVSGEYRKELAVEIDDWKKVESAADRMVEEAGKLYLAGGHTRKAEAEGIFHTILMVLPDTDAADRVREFESRQEKIKAARK